MKKTLVAMAALAATSAFAQSTVEIYGIIDQGYSVTNSKHSDRNFTAKLDQVSTGQQSGSATQRIGFRGTEDLGGGTKALFQIEQALTAGNAGTNGMGSRPTFVGLSDDKLGTLTLGRQDSPMLKAVVPQLAGGANNVAGQMNWSGFTINPDTGAAPVATAGLARMAGHTDFVTNNNAINYKTATYNGLSAEFQYGKASAKLNADVTGTGTLTANSKVTTEGMNVTYAAGPLTVNAATNKSTTDQGVAAAVANTAVDAAITAAAQAVYKTNYLGATYDLGVAKLSLTTISDKYNTLNTEAFKAKGNQIGAQIPVNAKVSTWVSYGKGKRQYENAAFEYKQTSMQIGAQYSFSKRTAAYGIYGSQKLAGNNAATTDTLKQNQYVLGLRHSF